ncbi:MAG TPA: aldolase/citrate lyase family protein [Bryobacteraceae bacterium]|nr:aldolase/citrate lyase family protein [Bryobacteraceae bacterium]
MVNSKVLEKLRAGDFVRCVSMSRLTDPWLAELIGRLGFDVIWLDMEHRPFGYGIVDPISLACRATGIDLMVRILKTGYSAPMRVLEFGANGVMVPHCRSAAEARQWVEWCRFPPLGRRGFDGAGADADYMLADPLEHLRHGNEQTFLVLQIEDREAVDCVDEIAAVPGVDLLFVGPGDLTISYGVPMQTGHKLVQDAIDRVAAACAKHGKWWGMPTGTPEAAQAVLDRGGRFITCGGDHGFLVNGYRNALSEFAGVHL